MENSRVTTLLWVNVALAAIFLISPWVFGFAAGMPLTSSLVGGITIGALSLAAIAFHRTWEPWESLILLTMVMGAYVFIAPILHHYNDANAVTWIQIVGGTAVATIATVQMLMLAGTRFARFSARL